MTMDQTGVVVSAGSGHTGDVGEHRSCEMAELRFQEEIQSLMRQNLLDDDNSNNSSFTALLGLAPNQAMELLHNPHHEIPVPVAVQIPSVEAYGCVVAAEQNQGPVTPKFVDFPQFRCSPTFPSNAALVERAARYSVFASEGSSPETSVVPSNSGNNSSLIVKSEPAGSDSDLPAPKSQPKRTSGKRKEPEKNKAKGSGKKTKTVDDGCEENNNGGGIGGGDKLPYVHVRARRGQATDSHSLAERARREKINARMKLLQELVPGCSKISGTALVLDEIINHVQSLQRQVEFLSMKLSAVNPRIDFGGLDSFLAPENTRVTGCNGGNVGLEASMWPEINLDGVRRQQQIWQVDLLSSSQQQPLSSMWDRDDDHNNNHQHHGFISSGPLLFGLDSTNPVSLHPNQLKTEI